MSDQIEQEWVKWEDETLCMVCGNTPEFGHSPGCKWFVGRPPADEDACEFCGGIERHEHECPELAGVRANLRGTGKADEQLPVGIIMGEDEERRHIAWLGDPKDVPDGWAVNDKAMWADREVEILDVLHNPIIILGAARQHSSTDFALIRLTDGDAITATTRFAPDGNGGLQGYTPGVTMRLNEHWVRVSTLRKVQS